MQRTFLVMVALLVAFMLLTMALATVVASDSPLNSGESAALQSTPTVYPYMEDPELPFATGDRVIAPRVDRSSSPFLMLTDEPRPPDFQDGVGCEYGRPMTVLGFASGEDGATHVSVTAAPDTVSVKRRGAGSNAV